MPTALEEIRALSDRELDAAVAREVMGWEVHPRNTAHWVRKESRVFAYALAAWIEDWRPSTDPRGMMEVLEHMRTLGCEGMISWLRRGDTSSEFVAHFSYAGERWGHCVAAQCAPRAVSEAALLAVRSRNAGSAKGEA